MNLIIYTTMISLFFCGALLATRSRKIDYSSFGENEYNYRKSILLLFAITLIVVEGFRHGYQDTINYQGIYRTLNDNLDVALKMDLESGYIVLMWLLRKICTHEQFIIIIAAAFITYADFRFIIKYSYNLVFSLFLYFIASFIGNMNGIRQLIAVSILTFAFPLAVEKKTFRYIIIVLLASSIHKSALVIIPLYFVFSGRRWNTLVSGLVGFCAISTVAPGMINFLIGRFFEDSYDNYINSYIGANKMNVVIAAVPFVLGLIYHLNNRDNIGENRAMDILINMQAISFAFMLLATTMAQYARIGMYMRHSTAIIVPFLIDKVFKNSGKQLVKFIAIVLYFLLFLYEVLLSNSRGYFGELYLDFSIFGG